MVFGVIDESSMGDRSGVTKKIRGQVRALEALGCTTEYIRRLDSGYWLACGNENIKKLSASTSSYNYKIKNECALNLLAHYKQTKTAPELLYIRGTRLFGVFHKLLSYVKKQHGKTVVEIPTVTGLFAQHGLRQIASELIDRITLLSLRTKIEAYVIQAQNTKLFFRRTIRIINGIDASAVKMTNPEPHEGIRLLAVAMMEPWHGYERIITGIARYYQGNGQKENVQLELVGEGSQIPVYKQLAEKNCLEDHIHFHGVLHGEELDKVYDRCDLGLGSFGMYKLQLKDSSILKLKEYCAKGLPFVYACPEKCFPEGLDFCKLFENNEVPININELVSFYYGLSPRLTEIRSEMRTYAEEKLSWTKEMKHVLEEVNK